MDLKELLNQEVEKIEEYAEFSKNEEFNFRLDNGEIGEYEIILRNPNGDEQMLSPISAALFVTDLPTYRQLLHTDLEELRTSLLNIDEYPSNKGAFDRLLNTIRNKATVIPFIGAGFSVASGCPTWSNYIISQAVRAGFEEDQILARLKNGEHESVMDEVIVKLSIEVFQRDFKSEFEGGSISPSISPSSEIIGLFDGCAITTNFDRVLENSHKEIKPYEEKVVGKDNTGRFLKAIYSGEKYLLKLHGNIDEQRDRILTQMEYNDGYGNGCIEDNYPIPKTLSKIFGGYTTLFLGCSLISDRYLEILKNVFDTGSEMMPEHFAIIPAPEDDDEHLDRDQFLASHGITPIWYPEGEWDKPEEILGLLKSER